MANTIDGISGSRTLHRLIYASRQQLDITQPPQYSIDSIIRVSIINNRQVDVSGLLLVQGAWFLQALEGPAEAVMTTYGRIINDPRHSGAKILSAGPAASRAFGDWNMCARHMAPSDAAIIDALGQRAAFDPGQLDGRSTLNLLKSVRTIQSRTQLSALR